MQACRKDTQDLAYDSKRQKIVYASGWETWEWDPTGWVRKGSSPFIVGTLAFDPSRGRTLFHGNSGKTVGTWEWDGKTWTDLKPLQTPPPRGAAWMVYVPALKGTVLFGGSNTGTGIPFEDTWLFDGKTWTQLLKTGLPKIKYTGVTSAVYDSARQRVVALYGGGLHRAFELSIETLSVDQPLPRPGENVKFQVNLPADAGMPFLLALSGASRPGIPLRLVPGVGFEHLPLAPDALFWASLQANLVRVLSAKGAASFTLKIPNDVKLLWLNFHAAGLSLRRGAIGAITNRIDLQVIR